MIQPTLFDPPYQPHSATSKAAAIDILPSTGSFRAKVLALLKGSPNGLTDEQIQIKLALNPSTQRPRRIELLQAGLIRDSGRTRKTRSNRSAVVWEAK